MAKKKEVKEEVGEDAKVDINALVGSFLKKHKKDHYNFEDPTYYKVSSGSLSMDSELEGGFGPGLHRFVGIAEGGKTSQSLEVMKNFLKMKKSRGVYFMAEGRLSPEMIARSGVKFVFDEKQWEDGTCFVFECNIYETVMAFMQLLIDKTDEKILHCFIVDSVDGLIAKGDLTKTYEESNKVAGGAVIAGNFMKRVGIPLTKRGHMAIFNSQVRADIKLDTYSKEPVRQTVSTGGNALLHFANWILQFEPRFQKDYILENPSEKYNPEKNKIIGHNAKVTVKKSPNERTNYIIKYPICHGRTDGTSIWVERELSDMIFIWEFAEKKGAWITFDIDFINTAKESGVDVPEKVNGVNKLNELIFKDEKLGAYLMCYFKKLILPDAV